MDNRIGFQTPRNLRLAAGILLLALALPGAALAFKSAYSSISMPGEFDSGSQWDPGTHKLELVSDYVWQGVIDVKKTGKFKFAANGSWDVNWGLGQEVSAVPTEDMGPLVRGGSDISLKLAAGKYRFVFFEDTETFSVLATNVTPYTSVKLVGSFNDDGALATGTMTNAGNGLWKTTLDLSYGATVRVQADGTVFGAHSAKGAVLSRMSASVALYGTTETVLQSQGGTFAFTMDFRSNLLSVVQTATNAFSLAAAGADGTFACGGDLPGQNLEDGGDNWWSGDFQVDQASFTLRFVGRDKDGVPGRWWGASTNVTALPAEGTFTASDSAEGTDFAAFNTGKGDYTFRFNPQSGSWTVRKRALSNMFQNASFEKLDGNGNPAGWGLFHAGSAPSSVYDAHSGTNSALLNRLYEDWENYGSIDQSVTLKGKEGFPFRVSASFRCGGSAWHGDTVRIIVEWKQGDTLLTEESTEVLNLSPAWQTVALDTTVPASNVTAHVLFKYDGAQLGETVLVDDVYAGIAASRTQNFDAWGRHDNFETNLSPDWVASSAKTILNAGEKVVGGVVISKYIEGTGNNKAIELYNGTASNINFKTTPYYIQQYNNGSPTASTNTIPLTSGTFYAGRCWRITRSFDATNYPPDKALLARNYFTTNNALTFNGDDVIVLSKGSTPGETVVDRVGNVGASATGSLWSRMATDHTLVRNSTVTNGNTSTNLAVGFDLSEWTVLDNGDFGDLGSHAFTDPDAGYLPSGYSLVLNTGATLTTPSLEGGVGDISFLARAHGATNGTDLKLVIETAPDEYSTSWTPVATVSIPRAQTTFTRYECSAGNSAHTVVRFRHDATGTADCWVRLDDIEIGRAYRIKRTENFAGWTAAAYRIDGLHTLAQWTLSGHVATNGVSGTLAGNLPIDTGYVQTPTFDGGLGQIAFSLCRPTATDSVQVTLSTSADGGSTWDEVQTFEFAGGKGTATNLSAWVYIPSNGCAKFACAGGTADAILDNISVGMPSTSREVDFDDLVPGSQYLTFPYKGWTITDTAVNNSTNAWSGYSGLVRYGIITSPYIDTVGSLSFMYRMGVSSGDDKARFKVEVSKDGKAWSTITAALAGTEEWQSYAYAFPTNSSWHYVRISQTTSGKRFFIDDISVNDFVPVPSVAFSSTLDPNYPAVGESFRIKATAYPRNGADILSVTGYVKYAPGGKYTPQPMDPEGNGDYYSDYLLGRDGGHTIISYATVWYGGVGVVPGTPGYAVTNLSSAVSTVKVSSVKSGEVWINEFSYAQLTPNLDPWEEEHEFVEICGKAGTDLKNWKIQLAYATSADIAANSNQVIYATYTITNKTELVDDTGSGYGFWLLADANNTAFPNRKGTLDNDKLDPIEPGNWDGWGIFSHIHNRSGVIRLVNQYGGVMHSISYGAYAEGTKSVPETQGTGTDTNSIGLYGKGGSYDDFSWTKSGLTPGSVNGGQILDGTITTDLMPIWHDPNVAVTTRSKGAFALFDPADAVIFDAVRVFYVYTTNDFSKYGDLGGTLYHRRKGSAAWQQEQKVPDFSGNENPTNNEAYFAFQGFWPYENNYYQRRDTMEYVIKASAPDYADTYLGTEDGTTSVAYKTFDEAEKHPFTHYFPTTDIMAITNIVFDADGSLVIDSMDTVTNTELQRLTVFEIPATTDLSIPVTDWPHRLDYNSCEGTNTFYNFTIPNSSANADLLSSPSLYFRIAPIR